MNVCCLSHPLGGIWLRHPSRVIQATPTRHCAAPWGSSAITVKAVDGHKFPQVKPEEGTQEDLSEMSWKQQSNQNSFHLGERMCKKVIHRLYCLSQGHRINPSGCNCPLTGLPVSSLSFPIYSQQYYPYHSKTKI